MLLVLGLARQLERGGWVKTETTATGGQSVLKAMPDHGRRQESEEDAFLFVSFVFFFMSFVSFPWFLSVGPSCSYDIVHASIFSARPFRLIHGPHTCYQKGAKMSE